MSAADDGGPAFPVNELSQYDGSVCAQHFGISVRDYFASAAMQGLVASLGEDTDLDKPKSATWCYEVADAMLVARSRAGGPAEICGNCDSPLPRGCGGLFKSDGAACKYKEPEVKP